MTTAQKVIVALRDEGLVVTGPMGTFVSEESQAGKDNDG